MWKYFFILAISGVVVTTTVNAQSDKAPAPSCPESQELIGGTLCIKFPSTDVLQPTAAIAAPQFTSASCHRDHEILIGNECINFGTGNIGSAEKTSPSTVQAAKK